MGNTFYASPSPCYRSPAQAHTFYPQRSCHWYEDDLGRTFAQAEQFTYSATSNGFALACSIPTLRGPFNLGSTADTSTGYILVNCNSPIHVTTDQHSGNSISGSCKGYYSRVDGVMCHTVTRITLYK